MGSKSRKCTDTEKLCPGCNEWKLHEEFYHHKADPKKPRGYCKKCNIEKSKAYTETSHYLASRGKAGRAMRDKAKRKTKARRRYKELNPDWLRWEQIEKAYGLTKLAWRTILEEQRGVCAICHKAFTGKEPHVDHNHATGMVRGLICRACNTALGLLCEDREILIGMIDYLDAHKKSE